MNVKEKIRYIGFTKYSATGARVIAPVKHLSQFLAVLSAAVGMSACIDMSSPRSQAPFLTCELITQNALGDIDPVPSLAGSYVAYRTMTAESPEVGELHYLRLDHPSRSHALLGPGEFHGGASWSPDSEWISYTMFERHDGQSFFVDDSFYKVNILTNQKIRLVDGWTIRCIGEHTSWTAKNEIIFSTSGAFYKVDAGGGAPEKILEMDMAFLKSPQHLAASPGGNTIAFSVDAAESDDITTRRMSGIWLAELDAGRVVQLTYDSPDEFPTWRDSESLLFQQETRRQDKPSFFSVYCLSLLTGDITLVQREGLVYSIAHVANENAVFAATAPRWNFPGDDWNIFRGFSISRCNVVTQENRDTERTSESQVNEVRNQ